jgi:hypothetical protein
MKTLIRALSALISLLGIAYGVGGWIICGVPHDAGNWAACAVAMLAAAVMVVGGIALFRLATLVTR